MPKRKKIEGRNSVDLATDFYSTPNANLVSFESIITEDKMPSYMDGNIPSIRTAEHERNLDKAIMQGENQLLYEGDESKGQLRAAAEAGTNLVYGYGATLPNMSDMLDEAGQLITNRSGQGKKVIVKINGKDVDINKVSLTKSQIESKYRENRSTATTRAKTNVNKWREKGLLNRKWEHLDPKIQNLLTDMSFQLGSKLSRPASEGGWEELPKAIERRDAVAIRKHLAVSGTKATKKGMERRSTIRRGFLKDLYKKGKN
jgi:hypothetical protein